MKTYIAIFIAFFVILSHHSQAQFPFDPPSADFYNGIVMPTGAGGTMAININFSDTTLWAMQPQKFLLGPQWGAAPRTINRRLHFNFFNEKYNYDGTLDFALKNIPRTSNERILISTNHDKLTGIAYAPAMQWDPEAPLLIPDQRWLPAVGDTTGAIFGFAQKTGGTVVGNHYALTMASAPSTGLTVLSGIQEHKGLVNSDTHWYFAINLRRADTVFQSDTTDPIVLKIRLPIKYFDLSTSTIKNKLIKFDSLLINNAGNRADIDYYSRGRWMDSKLVAVDSDTVIIIRRSMLPKFSDTCDVTLSAFFQTKATPNDTSSMRPNPPFREGEYDNNSIGRIDSFDIRIDYFPTCNVNINWVRLETPNARKTFRGHWDTIMYSPPKQQQTIKD